MDVDTLRQKLQVLLVNGGERAGAFERGEKPPPYHLEKGLHKLDELARTGATAIAKSGFGGVIGDNAQAIDVQGTNALPSADDVHTLFTMAGALFPPYDPEVLSSLLEHSNALRPNVDAYKTNIDGFGFRLEPVINPDDPKADDLVADALYLDRLHDAELSGALTCAYPSDEDVAAKKKEIVSLARLERAKIEAFIEHCAGDIAFKELRRRMREDLEVTGNSYWEVVRNGAGQVAGFHLVPSYSMRLAPIEHVLHEVKQKRKVTPFRYDTATIKKRFRRYIQIVLDRIVFFKEFGDTRVISKRTGRVWANEEELRTNGQHDGPATEIIHFRVWSPRSPYGVPRWIGNLLAVLGSRASEEVNYLYFDNKAVPPMALLVSGGKLAPAAAKKIESYIADNLRGKENFHRIMVVEAEPAGSGPKQAQVETGRVRLDLVPLRDAQQQDAMFQEYDQNNQDKIGQSFRVPRLLRGDTRDFNRACYSADTETLTEHGWKRHEEIADDERIAVYDPEKDAIRFERPASKLVYAVENETLIRFVGQHCDVLVTPEHKMLTRTPDRGWQVEPASATADRARFEFRCAPALEAEGEPLTPVTLPKRCQIQRGHTHEPIAPADWLEFLGYFLSDGGLLETEHPSAPYLVFLRQKKQPYEAQMRCCLERIGWAFSEQQKEDGTTIFTISNRCLRDWLVTACGGRSATRRLPDGYATALPHAQLEILWAAMKAGDGGLGKQPTNGAYYSASKALIDDAQTIAVRLGLRAHVSWVEGAGVFRLGWSSWRTTQLSEEHVERVPYTGDVYCFACPGAGFFVTRRNGKVALQGNTADAALQYAETQVFQGEREAFDDMMNRLIFTALEVRFWRFISNSPVNRDPLDLIKILDTLAQRGVLTVQETREIAADILNKAFPKIDSAWAQQPMVMTLAGVIADPTTGALSEPAPAAGAAPPALGQKASGGTAPDGTPLPDPNERTLVTLAGRLMALRDQLAKTGRAGYQANLAKATEEETVVTLEVPAETFREWVVPDAQTG